MKKRKKYLIIGTVILSLLVIGGLGFTSVSDLHGRWYKGYHHGFRGGDVADFISWKMDRHVKDLNLDDTQNREYENIKAVVQDQIAKAMERRREFHDVLQEEISKESPDLNNIVKLGKERLAKMPAMINENLDLFMDFYNRILTDEQRAKVIERIRERCE